MDVRVDISKQGPILTMRVGPQCIHPQCPDHATGSQGGRVTGTPAKEDWTLMAMYMLYNPPQRLASLRNSAVGPTQQSLGATCCELALGQDSGHSNEG